MSARSAVSSAVVDDGFLLDCLARELFLIERSSYRDGLAPFFTMPDLGIRFAFGYWPPGGTPGPHEHTAWTITAVCRNFLEVVTFDRHASYRTHQLVIKNRFSAPAGRCGFIHDPCIHQPINTTADWSLSLHVISPRDGEPLSDFDQPLEALAPRRTFIDAIGEHPYKHVIAARQRYTALQQIARVLLGMSAVGADELRRKCAQLGFGGTGKLSDTGRHEGSGNAPLTLSKTHQDLLLSCRQRDEWVVLSVDTPRGPIEMFSMNDVAYQAIAFAARESMFEIQALPGDLSDGERVYIAEALEQSGLFKRMQQ